MVLMAALSGVPTAIQEQNVFPGLTNRLLSKFVRRIFIAYPEAGKYFNKKKIVVTGNPIRNDEFNSTNRNEAERILGLIPNQINLLVFGGSQSARPINHVFLGILEHLLVDFPQLQIILVTGNRDYQNLQAAIKKLNLPKGLNARIKPFAYFYKMAEAYAVADIVIARAGAISLAEITCLGIPAILIPYPFASGNHQEFNARVLEKYGAAKVIPEAQLNAETLWENVKLLVTNSELRRKMAASSLSLSKPDAAARIVTQLLELNSREVIEN
jgi:UDP-N-acetylglucosamine--N-acetylmuramyl-(pentapeptide) pyrophosphoryl-undecaprenol N-acetylglucosamine transferase